MERLLQDLRFATRLLWRERGFAVTTMATLAVCVAANTAIFAIVDAVLLRPLPFPEPGRLVAIYNSYPRAGAVKSSNGVPDYFDRLAGVPALAELAMFRPAGVTIGGQGMGEVERVTGFMATPSLFRILGAAPHRGQLFGDQDAEPGRDRKVILSHGLWQRAFGGREDVVGGDLRINGVLFSIAGVMPDTFRFFDPEVELWMPAAFTATDRADDMRHSNNWHQIGRLRADATIEQAQSQIDAINARNLEQFPELKDALVNAGFHTRVRPLQDELVEGTSRTLYLLWGGVLCVLLVGCVNVANLVSVRASARARELATRHALGASLRRLSRQIFTETVLLAVLGGALGLALGAWALEMRELLGLDRLPRGDEIVLHPRSIGFTILLLAGVGLAVGMLPVIALRRANLALIVRDEGRAGTASRRTTFVRRTLVTAQVAFALVLLVGAGLLLASFQRVLAIDPGFDSDRLLTGRLSFPAARYQDAAAVRTTQRRMLEDVRSVPGVLAAGFTTTLPLSGDHSDAVIFAEDYRMAPGESLISPNRVTVSPGYFSSMRTALTRGRDFDERDAGDAPRVVIVDEMLARKFWPGQDPIGRRMYFPATGRDFRTPPPEEEWLTVVGVAENVRLDGLVDGLGFQTVGAYYLPLGQWLARNVTLMVRTAQAPDAATNAIRQRLAGIDPEMPLYGVRPMDERVRLSLVDRRTPMVLATAFAATALLLAAIGIYGVLAYQVSQRTREIGIRIALGAAASSIFGMVLREGAAIVAIGGAFGLLGAYMLRTTLQTQLYEIGAMDPRVIVVVAGLLLVVALIACLLPARKAARIDPVVALTQ